MNSRHSHLTNPTHIKAFYPFNRYLLTLVMSMKIDKDYLLNFEEKVASLFNQGRIRAPVHLSNGGEDELIAIFSKIKKQDYVFSTWRSHYHALLKGVPPEMILSEILDGNSISLNFPNYNFFTSAIVGTHIPVSVGVAYALKNENKSNQVWCFLGDMASETGIAQTSMRYALRWQLPVTFVIEDNNLSVCTETRKIWNTDFLTYQQLGLPNVISYRLNSKYPHAGAGIRVQF